MRVPLFPYVTPDRDYSELSRRYGSITVPLDFSHVELPWTKLEAPGPDKWGALCVQLREPDY